MTEPEHIIQVEKALIGALLLGPPSIAVVRAIVHVEDFLTDANAVLFSTLVTLAAQGEAGYLPLADELERRGQLEAVGGRSYLLELAAAVPLGDDAVQYAQMLAALAAQRRATQSGGVAGHAGLDEERP